MQGAGWRVRVRRAGPVAECRSVVWHTIGNVQKTQREERWIQHQVSVEQHVLVTAGSDAATTRSQAQGYFTEDMSFSPVPQEGQNRTEVAEATALADDSDAQVRHLSFRST